MLARSDSAGGSSRSRRDEPRPRAPRSRSALRRDSSEAAVRTWCRETRSSLCFQRACQGLLEQPPRAVQPRHDGADRNRQDLRRLLVAELAEIDQYEHVAEVVWQSRQGIDDAGLRESIQQSLFVVARVVTARRRVEAVVEGVVAFLQRAFGRSSLLPPASIAVDVGEDAKKPGAHVSARCVGAQTRKSPRVGLLHQLLRLFFRAGEMTSDFVDLIGMAECLLLESHPAAGFFCEPAAGCD